MRITLGEPGRLSPPIWPCTTRGFPCLRCCHRSGGLLPHLFTLAKGNKHCEGVSQVYLRDATELLRRRSIFCGTFRELHSQYEANLASTEPLPRRYLARCPFNPRRANAPRVVRHQPLRAYNDGVRTFLPSSRLATARPTITRLTRHLHYIADLGANGGKPLVVDSLLRNPYPAIPSCTIYFAAINFSNSSSVSTGTPNSFALSYFDPGSVPTTT